jgi:hypothetical protein
MGVVHRSLLLVPESMPGKLSESMMLARTAGAAPEQLIRPSAQADEATELRALKA